MDEDPPEGFLYPVINEEKCTQCNSCKESCHALLYKDRKDTPLRIFAAKNLEDRIRKESSSGGIFTLLAEYILKDGGVFFGAKFNKNWVVVHDYIETIEGLAAFRGSKYVQSVTGETYKQTREFLLDGRKVLYSGTPCQISGLKSFLQKDYNNLLTLDFVCHGVPSPLVWKKYLNDLLCKLSPPRIF